METRKNRIYLDYAASTPVLPEAAKEAQLVMLSDFGNPSSLHQEGQRARAYREKTRQLLAQAIGANPDELFFTSGGTESDHLAVLGIAHALKSRGNHIITSSIEHSAVFEICQILEEEGFQVTYLPVPSTGIIEPEVFQKALKKETILASIMMVNNEIGTIQPIQELVQIAKNRSVYFHTDAVQAFPYLAINVKELQIDALTVSAHKIYAPKGTGALYLKRGTPFKSPAAGGEQERKVRPGTENMPGIAGFGKAIELLMRDRDKDAQKISHLRNQLEDSLLKKIDHTLLNGDIKKRVPGILNLTFQHADGESLLIHLDLEGISCSTGSACAAGAPDPSRVLTAIGRTPEEAKNSIRFSLGKFTHPEEIEVVSKTVSLFVQKLRSASAVSFSA